MPLHLTAGSAAWVQVPYCCQHEYCETVEDFITRRTRMAYTDTAAALKAIPRVSRVCRLVQLAGCAGLCTWGKAPFRLATASRCFECGTSGASQPVLSG